MTSSEVYQIKMRTYHQNHLTGFQKTQRMLDETEKLKTFNHWQFSSTTRSFKLKLDLIIQPLIKFAFLTNFDSRSSSSFSVLFSHTYECSGYFSRISSSFILGRVRAVAISNPEYTIGYMCLILCNFRCHPFFLKIKFINFH